LRADEVLRYAFCVLAIHGGAGNFGISDASAERIASCRELLREAMLAGKCILDAGKSSLDAVEAAILVMEDAPLFNAGRGSVFTHEGSHELDACIMSGPGQRAGAIAGSSRVRNPIRAARALLEHSDHVLLSGQGADRFAEEQGLVLVESSYFATDERRQQLNKALASEEVVLDHEGSPGSDNKFGTVGAVALDHQGHLAAGTSTGGMTNKRSGRIGDSPIVGAGTFADSNVAVSCTGHGEYFMRYTVASDVAARIRWAGQSLAMAANGVIAELAQVGGSGGLIAIDRSGAIALPTNTSGMFRAWLDRAGQIHVAVFADEGPPGGAPLGAGPQDAR
jgi:beta-aspartyl-peptidase (threonine type)